MQAVLFLFLVFFISVAVSTATVISSKTKTIRHVRGQYRYYYNENSSCKSVVMLNVGTAMSVKDYSDIATDIAADSDTVVIIIDNNPRRIAKTSEKKFAGIANAIVSDLSNLVPVCKKVPENEIIVGGHSAGGQASILAIQKKLLTFEVAGYIGLAPYKVNVDTMTIDVPSMLWGFSKTTCAVTNTKAALAAYEISDPEDGRVFYQVQTHNFNTLTGGPHCSFTNSGCFHMCTGGKKFSWVHDKVAYSVGLFVKAVASNQIRKAYFETNQPGIDLFVNNDEVVSPQSSVSEGAVQANAYA